MTGPPTFTCLGDRPRHCGRQRNDISVDPGRHLVAKNRKHNVLLIRHAHRTAHPDAHRGFLCLYGWCWGQVSGDCVTTRVSKVQNQSQRERRIRIRGQIVSVSHCVLQGRQTERLCTACRTAHAGDKDFYWEYFHNTQQSSPMRRLCVRDAAETLGKRREVTPTGGVIPFLKQKKWDSDTLQLISTSSEFRNEDTPMWIREGEADYREWCYEHLAGSQGDAAC